MKRTILFLAIFFSILNSTAQPYFNRIYRLDPRQGNATAFFSLRVVNDNIYTAGIGVFNVNDSIVSNSGIFTSFDMAGNLIKNTYYGVIPTNCDFNDDLIQIEPNNEFSLTGYNFNYTFRYVRIKTNGDIVLDRTYPRPDSSYLYGSPSSIIKMPNGYAISIYQALNRINKAIIFMTNSQGDPTQKVAFYEDYPISIANQVLQNKQKKLVTLITKKITFDELDTTYINISQLREIDTLGNTLWVYNTPRDRFIYIKKFVQLANGNYLVWGDEELSKNVWGGTYWYRSTYDVKPYLAEINPQHGIIWEKQFDLRARMYGFKMLKDSSMVLSCFYDDGFFNTTACLIKLNKNRDSIFRRNFRATSLTSNRVTHYPNQIEELPNGDLLIGGYVWDLPVSSPTTGQWGWLVRTDSMGCSLEPSSCRTPTKEIEDTPLSIKAYPNPTSGSLTIDFDIPTTFKEAYIHLTDILGREVLRQKIDNQQGQLIWQTEQLKIGFYIISIVADNRNVEQIKVSIQK